MKLGTEALLTPHACAAALAKIRELDLPADASVDQIVEALRCGFQAALAHDGLVVIREIQPEHQAAAA